MKYCPECSGEFFDEVESCSECSRDLVSALDWEKIVADRRTEDRESFVKLKTVENQFEADIIKDVLEKESIPVLVRSFQDTSFNGIFIPQKGWGIILVPEEHRAKAKEALEIATSNES